MGIQIKTTNQKGKSIQDIAETWQKLFVDGIYDRIENKINHKIIGLYNEYEKDATKPYMFLAGAEVSENGKANQEFICIKIPKGKYAKFIVIGDIQKSVGNAWQEIWNMDLKRKYTCDFEEYQNHSDDMQKQEIHIYIALEN